LNARVWVAVKNYRLLSFPPYPVALAGVLLLLACGSQTNTVTSPSALSKCSVTVGNPGSMLPAGGGSGSVTVASARECQWTASADAEWLSVTSGGSGQGDGTVQFSAAANADPVTRSGAIVVAGQRAVVNQAAGECRFELSPASADFGMSGGSGTVQVSASSQKCTWTVASDAPWIAIRSGGSGAGNATVGYDVAPSNGPPRSATLTIAGQRFAVTQTEGCTYSISPQSFTTGAAGGSGQIVVSAGVGCPWTASSGAAWITVAQGSSGAGDGQVSFTVAATNGPVRTGTMTVAGKVFTVTQSQGCSYDVSPLSHSLGSTGGTGTVNVGTTPGCTWSATTNDQWITITGGASGNAAGSVSFGVSANPGPGRTGSLTVAGRTVTITQAAQACSYSISPAQASADAGGATLTVTVTAGTACGWTATADVPWLSVAAGANGVGTGTVTLVVAANGDAARVGTATIAGQPFTVSQPAAAAPCAYAVAPDHLDVLVTGGSWTVAVTSGSSCPWTSVSNTPWVTVASGAAGTGSGNVQLDVQPNPGPARTGTVTVAGRTITVNQAALACEYVVNPTAIRFDEDGGEESIAVVAIAPCTWTAVARDPWIEIKSGASGAGGGTVKIRVGKTRDDRQGTLIVAGQTVTVTQTGRR
jgi:hypothetical protein